MRATTFSSLAILATSLLAREVLAGRYDVRKRNAMVVTDQVIVTEEITVTAEADGTYETGFPVAIGTTTINGVPVIISSTLPAVAPSTAVPTPSANPVDVPAASKPAAIEPAPSSSASSAPGGVFLQESSSTTARSTPGAKHTPARSSSIAIVPATSSVTHPPVATTPPTVTSAVTSAAPVAATSAAPVVASSGNKRGLAYNDASLLPGFVSSKSKVEWCYNWASSSAATPAGIEYVALLWGMQDEFTSVWTKNADAALAAGSTHLMSFNEPDLAAQSNLDVSAAVAGYMKYMQPYAGKAKLGAPAVTNGGSPMGLTYLGNFLTALKNEGGQVDFCAIHWYDSATNIAYFKNYMQEASAACNNKPIWLTEFGASGSDDEVNTFLETVLPWMDSQSYIERYAYFMVTPGSLISSGTTLSTIGETFAFA